MNDSQEPWFAARCIFCHLLAGTETTFEERIVLLRAASEEDAFRLAEEDAGEYAAGLEGCVYTGFVDLFHLFETEVGHRTEVFSLMRSSDLSEQEYLNRYYNTGLEHWRTEPEQ